MGQPPATGTSVNGRSANGTPAVDLPFSTTGIAVDAPGAGPAGGAGASGKKEGQGPAGLGTVRLALIVVAAAAPLAAVVGNLPAGFMLGTGPGLPVVFAVAGAVVAAVAVGYLTLAREVPGATGFASFVQVGLGDGWGLGAAYASTLAYAAGTVSLAVATGYFGSLIVAGVGLQAPWWALSLGAVAVAAVLGRRAADLSATLLLGFMAAEFAVLVALDVAVVARLGAGALPATVLDPATMVAGHLGPALMTGFTSFIGVESAVVYTREARDPQRTVPRATYLSIAAVVVFYVLTAWIVVGAIGPADVVARAADEQGDLVFTLAGDYAGPVVMTLMQLFFGTSALACLVALHNATARYARALAADGGLPAALAAVHPRHGAPTRASDVLAVLTVLVVAVPALLGAAPYVGLGTSLTGLFTVGVVGVQALVALAVVVHFRRRRDPRLGRTLVAPALGGAGVCVAVGAMAANYPVLTSSASPLANALPVLLVVALAAGPVVVGRRRRRTAA